MKYVRILLYILFFYTSSSVNGQDINLIIGRPTDTSITLSVLSNKNGVVFYEWGEQTKQYTAKSLNYNVIIDQPIEIEIGRLKPNTRYYSRLGYKSSDTSGSIIYKEESTFNTQRSKNSMFSFAVEADPHLDTNTNPESFALSLKHMLSKKIDFLVDLGDNFMNDKLPMINENAIAERNILFRNYFSLLNHSAALYIAMGNHEGELGWLSNSSNAALPTMAANIRKKYYPNPYPNGFYSGNTTLSANVGLRENYYAWEWGDALFVVIDPYFYTQTKPGWGWTLGAEQYNWLASTLKNSTSKYKFIFSHQLVGGSGTEGRGGTEFAHLYEMGGYNDDSTYGFAKYRPGWAMPIHKLFVEYKVNIFFHGHDHCYGRQIKDGVVYQEVPQPSAKNINTITGTAYGYKEGVFLPNRGYMLVTVTTDSAKVDYIRTYLPTEENSSRKNGDIAHSYTIKNGVVTSIKNEELINSIQINPNPATNYITLKLNVFNKKLNWKIIDFSGKTIIYGNQTQIDISKLNAGNYIIQLHLNDYIINKKFIVSK